MFTVRKRGLLPLIIVTILIGLPVIAPAREQTGQLIDVDHTTLVSAIDKVAIADIFRPVTGVDFAKAGPDLVGPPRSVTFQSQRDGNYEIYVMNPDGTDQTRVTYDAASDTYPDISTNGKKIVFTSNRVTATNPEGDNEIFTINIDGSDVTQLTFNNANDAWPRWSPNGKQIAFHSNVDGNFEIYIINADGSDLTRATNYPGVDQWPSWSPNGKQLAIRRDNDVYLINVDGTDPVRLTDDPALDQMASFSPNGKQLAFMSLRAGYCSVFVMNSDGSDQVNLTPKEPDPSPSSAWCSRGPSWSMNGKQIYFTSFRPSTGGNFEIFAMNADGTDVTRLTDAPGEDGFPNMR